MSGLEQAIRNALERAERSNPEIRSRIYQSARNALDAGLRKQDVEDDEVIARQRQRLEATIRAIEDEELQRLAAIARLEKVIDARAEQEEEKAEAPAIFPPSQSGPVAAAAAPALSAAPDRVAPPRVAPETRHVGHDDTHGSLFGLSATRDDAPRSGLHEDEDLAWAEPTTPEGRSFDPKKRSFRRRAGSAAISLFVYSVLLAVVIGGLWWVWATGMLDAALKGSGDFDLIPKELQTEDYDPASEPKPLDPLRNFSGEWIPLFKADQKDRVSARLKAAIGEARDSDGLAATLASGAPDQDGEILIEVPADIIDRMAGRTSTLAVTVKSMKDAPAQIYVQCEFASLGGCGRHRFTVTNEKADELIQVKFDRTLAPDAKGHIVINTDLTGEGGAVKLYGIRVLPGN